MKCVYTEFADPCEDCLKRGIACTANDKVYSPKKQDAKIHVQELPGQAVIKLDRQEAMIEPVSTQPIQPDNQMLLRELEELLASLGPAPPIDGNTNTEPSNPVLLVESSPEGGRAIDSAEHATEDQAELIRLRAQQREHLEIIEALNRQISELRRTRKDDSTDPIEVIVQYLSLHGRLDSADISARWTPEWVFGLGDPRHMEEFIKSQKPQYMDTDDRNDKDSDPVFYSIALGWLLSQMHFHSQRNSWASTRSTFDSNISLEFSARNIGGVVTLGYRSIQIAHSRSGRISRTSIPFLRIDLHHFPLDLSVTFQADIHSNPISRLRPERRFRRNI